MYKGMTESYFFYGGTVELKYAPDPEHRYYKVDPELGNLIPVWGVTSSTHIINAAERLVPWAAKVTIAKLLRLIPTETVEGVTRIKPLTLEEFTTLALEAKKAHKEHLDDAADVGHLAHKCLEESILNAIKTDPEKIVRELINPPSDELARNAANSAKAWMDAHRVRWVETESKVYSLKHNVAGTTDGLAICDSCTDKACCSEEFRDHLSIVDWKASNYLNVGYLFQVAFYKSAKQEELGLDIKDCWINRLGKSEEEAGKFEAWFVPDKDFAEDIEGFLTCLRLTQLVEAAEERMKLFKGKSRAIRKAQKLVAKELKKEQEKLQKALKKAEEKRLKQIEKEKTKEAARLRREELKALKKAGALGREQGLITPSSRQISDCLVGSTPTTSTKSEETPREEPRERRETRPRMSDTDRIVTKAFQVSGLTYEEEPKQNPISIPQENA
jgi:hypothetical protein